MSVREQAIEAAARAIFGGCDEVWDSVPAEQGHYRHAANRALRSAVPVLLNDLADRIEAMPATVGPLTPGSSLTRLPKSPHEVRVDAAALVRAAAEGWNE